MLCDSDNNSNNNNNGGDSSSKSSDSEWLTRRSKKKNATFYVYETKIYIKRYMVCIIYRRKANSADCPLAAHSYDFSLFLSIFLQKSIFTKHTFAIPSLFFTISHSVIHILSLHLDPWPHIFPSLVFTSGRQLSVFQFYEQISIEFLNAIVAKE